MGQAHSAHASFHLYRLKVIAPWPLPRLLFRENWHSSVPPTPVSTSSDPLVRVNRYRRSHNAGTAAALLKKAPVGLVGHDHVFGEACVPAPLPTLWLSGLGSHFFTGLGHQAASVGERNKVAANPPLRFNQLLDNGVCAERDFGPQLLQGGGPYPLLKSLLIADHAARDMPARPEDLIIPPGQQDAPLVIANQEVHIDHGDQAANEQEQLQGQPSTWF